MRNIYIYNVSFHDYDKNGIAVYELCKNDKIIKTHRSKELLKKEMIELIEKETSKEKQ